MRIIVVIALFLCSSVLAQDTSQVRPLEVRGYLKDLQSITFQDNFSEPITGNLIHNRLNFKWTASQKFKAAVELRNRLFWGEEVKFTPEFSSHLRNSNEAIRLSVNWADAESVVFNTTVDRMWAEYSADKWNLRLGRQRINWGIGTTWNPNDLFNTYNFLDFDYEERPGADAVKFQYYTSQLSNLEFAFSMGKSENTIGAIKYFVNTSGYDLQLITGWFYQQPTVGLGWSGNIKENGFKGELQYFFSRGNLRQQINIAMEMDRLFAEGWYAKIGICLNSVGITKAPELWQISSVEFSPKNLMPTKWNTLLMMSKEITPLFTATATVIYAPGPDLVFVLPGLSYNLTQDLDVDIVWQSFLGNMPTGFKDISHRAFIRIKLSF